MARAWGEMSRTLASSRGGEPRRAGGTIATRQWRRARRGYTLVIADRNLGRQLDALRNVGYDRQGFCARRPDRDERAGRPRAPIGSRPFDPRLIVWRKGSGKLTYARRRRSGIHLGTVLFEHMRR